MKHTIAFSLDSEVIAQLRLASTNSKFRNKSHLVEQAIRDFLQKEVGE